MNVFDWRPSKKERRRIGHRIRLAQRRVRRMTKLLDERGLMFQCQPTVLRPEDAITEPIDTDDILELFGVPRHFFTVEK